MRGAFSFKLLFICIHVCGSCVYLYSRCTYIWFLKFVRIPPAPSHTVPLASPLVLLLGPLRLGAQG